MLKRIFLFVLLFLTVLYIRPVRAYTPFPEQIGKASGFVNDFAGVLATEQRTTLEAKLAKFERETSNEITVVIIKSLDGNTVENYATKLFEGWGIGKTKRDNGVLLLIAIDDRQMRIEVGYGLEGALTDLQSNSIIMNDLRPAFRAGDYFGGIDKAVDDMMAATRGEYTPVDSSDYKIFGYPVTQDDLELYLVLFWIACSIVIWIVSILARSKSWWAGGVIGGIIGIVVSNLLGFLYYGLLSLVILIPLGLLLDFVVSRAYQKGESNGHYPWWIGGDSNDSGSDSGWGGGGFGGFGGGHSGGGGSSGSW